MGWDKEMQDALRADAEKLSAMTGEDHSVEFFDFEDEYCPNCGGEGFVHDCIDGCCIDADFGCDLCTTRCDWCNPRTPTNKGGGQP